MMACVYHRRNSRFGICAVFRSGEDLIQREDDKEDTVRKRLDVYQSQTRPLVAYYSQWAQSGDSLAPVYRKISGTGSVDYITQRALAALA